MRELNPFTFGRCIFAESSLYNSLALIGAILGHTMRALYKCRARNVLYDYNSTGKRLWPLKVQLRSSSKPSLLLANIQRLVYP